MFLVVITRNTEIFKITVTLYTNFGAGVLSIFDHVTCLAKFKHVVYNIRAICFTFSTVSDLGTCYKRSRPKDVDFYFYCPFNKANLCSFCWFNLTSTCQHKPLGSHRESRLRGLGGVFIKILSKLTLELFLIEGSDIFQMLLVPWKNIVPNRNYCRSKVSAYV